MKYEGLLTDEQKRAGYFITQDEDFIFLFRGRNTNSPTCIGVWLYQTARIKEVRDKVDENLALLKI